MADKICDVAGCQNHQKHPVFDNVRKGFHDICAKHFNGGDVRIEDLQWKKSDLATVSFSDSLK